MERNPQIGLSQPAEYLCHRCKKVKVAVVINVFPPKWLAGTEIATYYLAETLAKRGHEVNVITSLEEGLPEVSCERGFHINRLPRSGSALPVCLLSGATASGYCKKLSQISPMHKVSEAECLLSSRID